MPSLLVTLILPPCLFTISAAIYNPKPSPERVIVSSKTGESTVTVCVQDFGIGINEKLIEKVFDKFFRVTEPLLNTFPGLGLGLYIAAEIVKRQGGTMSVSSTEGKGSAFCFTLPFKR